MPISRWNQTPSSNIRIAAPAVDEAERVLVPGALWFIEDLARRFTSRVDEMLERRVAQARYDDGDRPNFVPFTAGMRAADWKVAPAPADLQDRHVEIIGPADRKMIINALNSGAQLFMADFEDANAPTWANMVSGQANLIDAVRRTITYVHPDTGKHCAQPARRHADGPAARLSTSSNATASSTAARFPRCCSTSGSSYFGSGFGIRD